MMDLSATECRREVAGLLARAVMRSRYAMRPVSPDEMAITRPPRDGARPKPTSFRNHSELAARGLEVSGVSRLTVHAG